MVVQREVSFAEVLETYVHQRGYTYGQLARLSSLPKRTIAHWLEGQVARPRDWHDLIKLASVLHLDEAETTRLLQAAHYPGVAQLMAQADTELDRHLLFPWMAAVQQRLEQSPFQTVADLPHFSGREGETRTLKQALLGTHPIKLCSLHGMAGAGKTALAIHLTYQLRAYFPDGVLWARLDNSDPMSILNSFARAYGLDVAEYKDLESRSRVVRELLAYKRVLIVLDNIETSDQVEPLLPPSGVCAVLLTTRRNDLAITRGALRFQIGPFERIDDSFELFAWRLGPDQVQRERESLLEIDALLGHLPLALDIAASRIAYEPGWSAVDFLNRLRDEKKRLGALVYENQSVRLSLDISYQMLSAEQKHVFHALGTLGGEDFSPQAAAYVADMEFEAISDHLRSLYALSLVQVARLGRYRLHPLLRDLALEKAPSADARCRMVAFFVQYADTHREDYKALDTESSNLFAALQTAFDCGLNAELIRGADALSGYLDVRGLSFAADLHLKRAVRAARILDNVSGQASLLAKLGLTCIHCGRLEDAEQHLQQGLELSRQAVSLEGMSGIMSLILGYLGLIAYFRNDYEQMERHLLEALPLAQESNQTETICRLLEGLNEIAQRHGNYAAAEAHCREGLTLARQLENPELVSVMLKSLANALFESGGDDDEINACLRESLAVARELGHPRIICTSLLSLGYIACQRRDYEPAGAYLQEAIQLMQDADLPMERVFVLCTLGLVAHGRRAYDQAATYLEEGLALARQVGVAVLVSPIQNAWGWLYIEQQAWDAAAQAFSEALDSSRQTGVRVHIAQALYGLAHLAAARGDLDDARHNAVESANILEAIGHRTRAEVRSWLSRV